MTSFLFQFLLKPTANVQSLGVEEACDMVSAYRAVMRARQKEAKVFVECIDRYDRSCPCQMSKSTCGFC